MLQIIVASICVPCIALLYSMNDIELSPTLFEYREVKFNFSVELMIFYMAFGLIWIINFLNYCSDFVVMVSASTYYWNSDQNRDGNVEVCLGFTYCLYHFGSVANAAITITLVRIVDLIVMWPLKKVAKRETDNDCLFQISQCATNIVECF